MRTTVTIIMSMAAISIAGGVYFLAIGNVRGVVPVVLGFLIGGGAELIRRSWWIDE